MVSIHTIRRLVMAGAVTVLLTACFGCSRVVNRTAERKIREALPDAIGPAREYRVHVENAPLQTVAGKFANVTIDGDAVQFPSGLLMDAMHIELKNVDIDTKKRTVRKIGDARFSISVSDASLDRYLAGESPKGETIRKTRLTFADNNVVTVTGERVTVLNAAIPFRLTGPVRAATPTRVEIDPRRLVVAGIPLSGGVLSFFKGRIESSLDLRGLGVPMFLNSVTTRRGVMTMDGSIDATALVARAQASK